MSKDSGMRLCKQVVSFQKVAVQDRRGKAQESLHFSDELLRGKNQELQKDKASLCWLP